VSPLDPQIPPAGEDIHLPGGSVQPLLVTLGVTVALIGVTFHWVLVVLGLLLTAWTVARWIADARREIESLPAEH
jgi:hypothetical protein